jgi:epoxyqueuosine reductase
MTLSASTTSSEESNLRIWLGEEAAKLGFDQLRITDTDLGSANERLQEWLAEGRHGSMEYMERHAELRSDPQLLVPGTIILQRLFYNLNFFNYTFLNSS